MNNTHYALFNDGVLFAVIKNNPATIEESVTKAIKEEFSIENISINGLQDAIRKVEEFNPDVSFSFTDIDDDNEVYLRIEMTWEY